MQKTNSKKIKNKISVFVCLLILTVIFIISFIIGMDKSSIGAYNISAIALLAALILFFTEVLGYNVSGNLGLSKRIEHIESENERLDTLTKSIAEAVFVGSSS